jgi:hypothetical protein
MKTVFAFLILAATFTAQAQFRYARYALPSTNTSTTIQTNTLATYNSAADVGTSSRADIMLRFKLTGVGTNAIVANSTNEVTARFDKSIDGTYYTNAFTFTVFANTNLTVWNITNISVTDAAYLRLVSITNGNAARVTNLSVTVGIKQGI